MDEGNLPQKDSFNNEQGSQQSEGKTKKEVSPKRKSITRLILVIALLIAVAVGVWGYISLTKKPVAEEPPKPAKADYDEQTQRFIHPTTGEEWLDKPKPIKALGYFENENDKEIYLEPIKYYEVGTHKGNTIQMTVFNPGMGDAINLFERSPSGEVSAISRPDKNILYPDDHATSFKDQLIESIKIDSETYYDSLSIPRKLQATNDIALTKNSYPDLGNFNRPVDTENTPKQKQLKKFGKSTAFQEEVSYADTQLTAIGYYVELPIKTVVYLTSTPLELSLEDYQWKKGDSTNDKLKSIARGCSNLDASVTRSDALTASDIELIGASESGREVYQVKDIKNNILFSKAYDEFKEFVKAAAAPGNEYEQYKSLTKEEFQAQHGLLIYKDSEGQLLVYTREQLAPAGGCAKPVVYLYPSKKQRVDVRVGADVVISDPFYSPTTGWQNVLAQPNGTLSYKGKSYDSLFWEGYGYGAYPSIKSGTVVKTAVVPGVIKKQLAELGLNQKETKDFLEYWVPRLPHKKYTIMSWITTEDMNNLAPLHISPKPDTVIRVFLDFWGSDVPVSLPQQTLQTTPRKGFTVVEWGGFLNGLLK